MIICCKGCGKCCDKCCSCIEQTCGDCCNGLNKCFNTPFSMCAFLTFLFVLVPAIVGVFMLLKMEEVGKYCVKPIGVHLAVMAACHLLNFLFALYLFCKFRKPYESTNNGNGGTINRSNSIYDAPKETNVWQRMVKILCYDFVTLFYVFVVIFEFAWAIVGHSWLAQSGRVCESFCPSTTGWDLALIIIWWVYLGIGLFVALLTICIQACDEGSCTCENCICGCIMCCTCGICGKTAVKRGNVHRLADVGFQLIIEQTAPRKFRMDRHCKEVFRFWMWSRSFS